MSDDALPEADRLDGAPTRARPPPFSVKVAEAAFLSALNAGRLPHAWLLTGPRGIGKATFAWRAARYLIATPPETGDALFAPPPAESARHRSPNTRRAPHPRPVGARPPAPAPRLGP
jgi:DNA polymerase-3 subunit delta'